VDSGWKRKWKVDSDRVGFLARDVAGADLYRTGAEKAAAIRPIYGKMFWAFTVHLETSSFIHSSVFDPPTAVHNDGKAERPSFIQSLSRTFTFVSCVLFSAIR